MVSSNIHNWKVKKGDDIKKFQIPEHGRKSDYKQNSKSSGASRVLLSGSKSRPVVARDLC